MPEQINTEEQLEESLTRPTIALQNFVKTLSGPLLVLGAGGKMGPSLVMLAQRAAQEANHPLEVIAVSRFTETRLTERLNRSGIRTISCDLLDRAAVRSLPEAPNLIFLVGLKFGTAQNPSATWAINTVVPTHVAERFTHSHVVALSTGNVYPLSEVSQGGSRETAELTPLGEYANSAVARERIFEYYSRAHGISLALVRLFYAVELRYGVLVDIARKVQAGAPIDLTSGYFNCIWQGDANDLIIRILTLASSPASAWNLCRPEVFSARSVAARFGELLGHEPCFSGHEKPNALLGNSDALCARLGQPVVSLETMIVWIAHWIKTDGRDLGKPTHFETRDGRY